ncbi:MAG: hypothetical protein ABL961_13615, partial [Vicinamibacterales bacterium]
RMRRALQEYVIVGIKTTVPFFNWLLVQPEFLSGQFHTTYLDEILKERNGAPFVPSEPAHEDLAAIAAAVQAVMAPGALASPSMERRVPTPAAAGRWNLRARAEGLR